MKVLAQISVPPRLRSDFMLTKHATSFDVPNTESGVLLMGWWEKAASEDRDALMLHAHDRGLSLTDALTEKLAGCVSS